MDGQLELEAKCIHTRPCPGIQLMVPLLGLLLGNLDKVLELLRK